MGVDDSIAPVEFLEDRVERGIAQPFVAVACEQADAVRLERIEAVFDLAEAGVNVRKRQCGEYTETARMIRGQSRRVLVAFAAKPDRRRRIVKGVSRRRDRTDTCGHARPVHILETPRGSPVRRSARETLGAQCLEQTWWHNVVMDVDPNGCGTGG